MVKAERAETTHPLPKPTRDLPFHRACQRRGVKARLQPLSPSVRAFARDTEKAECGKYPDNSMSKTSTSFIQM